MVSGEILRALDQIIWLEETRVLVTGPNTRRFFRSKASLFHKALKTFLNFETYMLPSKHFLGISNKQQDLKSDILFQSTVYQKLNTNIYRHS
jgi:hypothetical protein